jgi:hypothetical protein
VLVRHQLCHEQRAGTTEEFDREIPQRAALRSLTRDDGRVSMRPAFFLVPDVSLGLKIAKDRENGRTPDRPSDARGPP